MDIKCSNNILIIQRLLYCCQEFTVKLSANLLRDEDSFMVFFFVPTLKSKCLSKDLGKFLNIAQTSKGTLMFSARSFSRCVVDVSAPKIFVSRYDARLADLTLVKLVLPKNMIVRYFYIGCIFFVLYALKQSLQILKCVEFLREQCSTR